MASSRTLHPLYPVPSTLAELMAEVIIDPFVRPSTPAPTPSKIKPTHTTATRLAPLSPYRIQAKFRTGKWTESSSPLGDFPMPPARLPVSASDILDEFSPMLSLPPVPMLSEEPSFSGSGCSFCHKGGRSVCPALPLDLLPRCWQEHLQRFPSLRRMPRRPSIRSYRRSPLSHELSAGDLSRDDRSRNFKFFVEGGSIEDTEDEHDWTSDYFWDDDAPLTPLTEGQGDECSDYDFPFPYDKSLRNVPTQSWRR